MTQADKSAHADKPTPETSLIYEPMPVRVDRRQGAKLISARLFPISPRTLETWPVRWRRVNGRALCETAELLAFAEGKFASAPSILGGRKTKSNATHPNT